jgi:predicted acetyltransferase
MGNIAAMVEHAAAHNRGMEIEIGPFSDEPRAFLEAGELAFGERVRDEDLATWEKAFEAPRAIVARDGDRIVGTAGILSFELTVPGGTLPAAGVTLVGVSPTHRRRGILRRMMRAQLDAIRGRGESLAILWASEGNIYQRFGYGLGTLRGRVSIERNRSTFRRPHRPTGTLRLVESDEGRRLFPPIFDAVRPTRPGFFSRSPEFWESEFWPDPEHWRRGAGPAWHVVHEVDGHADGYARYRIRDAWEDAGPKSTVVVVELMATNIAAHLDLWRYLLDIDLTHRLEVWNLAPDDPILLSVAEPRRLELALGDALWLRVVNVEAALAGRRYAADGHLVLEVADEFCPWNVGRWSLAVEDGEARVDRTTDAAELACDITDLGAAYLGGFSFIQLADAGRVQQLVLGAVERADALFRTARVPWCPKVF